MRKDLYGIGQKAKRPRSARECAKEHSLFWAGLFIVSVIILPLLLLGQDSVITYHDQLDGEMIAYILHARHLFSGDLLPEFLGGVSKTALTLPAPLSVIFFLAEDYFVSFVLLQMVCCLTGYAGMYLLAKKITGYAGCSFIAGVFFAYLPFLPVYGLSQTGIPLLLWCFLEAYEGRHRVILMIYAGVFALDSSLVLSGFGVLGLLFAGILVCFFRSKEDAAGRKRIRYLFFAWLLMLGLYLAENFSLLVQLLGTSRVVSHKAEYVLTPESFWSGLWTYFLEGGQHSTDNHIWILAGAAGLLILLLLGKNWRMSQTGNSQKLIRIIILLTAGNFFFAFLAALWNSQIGMMLRDGLSALGAFQLDRVLWIAPTFWYLMLACLLGVLAENRGLTAFPVMKALITCGLAGVTVATGVTVLLGSSLKPNLQKLRDPDYRAISYRDYYAIGVMDQVMEYIRTDPGLKTNGYRVVSLGIDPAAALYAGFYCLDGYSNNYPLEYKVKFREIIAPELEKSDYLKDYYDNWGNRVYLLSSESPGYYTIQKGGFYFQDYRIDTAALKELGGKYLLSAAYIQNAESTGLRLVREEAFETADSYYRIFLYEITPDLEGA